MIGCIFETSASQAAALSDDQSLETQVWEVDSCGGHFNNVFNAVSRPKHELIENCGDKTFRAWRRGRVYRRLGGMVGSGSCCPIRILISSQPVSLLLFSTLLDIYSTDLTLQDMTMASSPSNSSANTQPSLPTLTPFIGAGLSFWINEQVRPLTICLYHKSLTVMLSCDISLLIEVREY